MARSMVRRKTSCCSTCRTRSCYAMRSFCGRLCWSFPAPPDVANIYFPDREMNADRRRVTPSFLDACYRRTIRRGLRPFRLNHWSQACVYSQFSTITVIGAGSRRPSSPLGAATRSPFSKIQSPWRHLESAQQRRVCKRPHADFARGVSLLRPAARCTRNLNFLTRQDVYDYLQSYSHRFRVEKHIAYNAEQCALKKVAAFGQLQPGMERRGAA